MPQPFLSLNLYEGDTLLPQCPFFQPTSTYTLPVKVHLFLPKSLFTLIHNDLPLRMSKPCLYYTTLSIYTGTQIASPLFSVLTGSF